MILVDPDSIIVEDRTRRDLGDIAALAESIADVGLLHPPVITVQSRLVAGERRLAAVKMLGWTECPVNVVDNLTDTVNLLKAERDENTCRKPLVPSEAVAIGERVEAVEKPQAEARMKAGVAEPCAKLAQGKTRDVVGSAVGMSGDTYRKAKTVVAASEADPETFGHFADHMDKSGKVDRAYKSVKQIEQAQARAEEAKSVVIDSSLILGDFRPSTVICDSTIDLIFTDPPYNENAVSLYRDLGVFAARVLKPGGVCLAYSGHAHLPAVMQAMMENLTYGWTCAIRHTGGELRFRNLHIRNAWKPILMYYKPPLSPWWDWFSDMASGGKEKCSHEWQQAEGEAAHYISSLTPEGGIVCDPFTGGGTTLVAAKKLGLRYIGYEIDEDSYNKAQLRLNR